MILFPVQSQTFSDPAIKALLEALLQSLSSGDKDIAKTYGPIIVGFFTILFGLIGTFALLFVQWRQNQSLNKANARQFALMKSKEERDEIIKKLNSFYGPFKLLRTQSRILYDLFALDLRPPNGNFRTLRYLLEGKQFVGQNEEILIQILEIGKKVLKLIEAHSGVVDRPELQELLGKLGAHIRILQLAHEKKLTGPPQAFEDIVFPVAIDGAIESAILRLQDRLKQLMEFESERDGVSAKTEELKDGTLEYYNSKVEEYANKTMFLDLSDFYRRFRAHLPRGGRILDAGCGVGRDVRYFIEQGYIVIAFDASSEMVRKCNEYPHAYCMQSSFDNIQFKEEFDGVWACASLLHLKREEAKAAMMRLTTALKPGGVIFVALKVGEGNKIDSGRYFEYYDETSVKELYKHDPRIEILDAWRSPPSSLEENGAEWLNLILQRKEHNPFKAA